MTRSPWLDDKPTPDVRVLERDALLDLWAANRNSLIGTMAADEMMRRLQKQRQGEGREEAVQGLDHRDRA